MTIWDQELTALDVETTGLLSDRGDRVIEIAIVRGRFGAAPRRWSSLVFPDRRVAATHIHGLTDSDVAQAPTFAQLVPTLAEHVRGTVLVAHNAPFDLRFIAMELARGGGELPIGAVVDTLGLARRHLALPSHALGALCDCFTIPRAGAHRALADAEATWALVWALLEVIDPDHELTLDAVLDRCRRRTREEHLALRRALLDAQRRGVRLLIDYNSADHANEARTRRPITVQRVYAQRVVAWCHLRDGERTFRLDRLRIV